MIRTKLIDLLGILLFQTASKYIEQKILLPKPTEVKEEVRRVEVDGVPKDVPVKVVPALTGLKIAIDGSGGFLWKISDTPHWQGRGTLLLPGNFPLATSVQLVGKNNVIRAEQSGFGNPDKYGDRQHWRFPHYREIAKKVGKKPTLRVELPQYEPLEFKLSKGLRARYD